MITHKKVATMATIGGGLFLSALLYAADGNDTSANHYEVENLRTVVPEEPVSATVNPPGKVTKGKVFNYGGWTTWAGGPQTFNAIVPVAAAGVHMSEFSGEYTMGGSGGGGKPLTWEMDVDADVGKRKLVVDWLAHPGAEIVLNNGELTDIIWADEQGSWPLFYTRGDYLQAGSNTGNKRMKHYGVIYDEPKVDNTGMTWVDGIITISGPIAYTDRATFTVKEEIQGVTVVSTSRKDIAENQLHAFGVNGGDADYDISTTNTIATSWSETTSTKNTTTVKLGASNTSEGELSGSVGVLSLKGKNSTTFSSELITAIEKTTSETISGSRSEVSTFKLNFTLAAGDKARWISYVDAKIIELKVEYYKDESPRDGFPDSDGLTVDLITMTVPVSMGSRYDIEKGGM